MSSAICVYPGNPEPLRFKDFPSEELPPGHVRVSGGTRSSCGTDSGVISGSHFIPKPNRKELFLILGHEAGGTVTECGEGVELNKGTRCSLKTRFANTAHPSRWHALDRIDLCLRDSFVVAGMFAMDGYFRREFVVPVSGVVTLPDTFPMELSSLPDLVSCVRKGIREGLGCRKVLMHPHDSTAERALVVGAGASGLTAAKQLAEAGCTRVVVVDQVEPTTTKARIALSVGSSVSYEQVRAKKFPEISAIAKELGPVDLVFEASGCREVGEAYTCALDAGGVVVWFGIPHGDAQGPEHFVAHASSKMMRNIIEVNTINATNADWLWAAQHLARNADYYRQLLYPVLRWNEGTHLTEVLRDRSSIKPRICLEGE